MRDAAADLDFERAARLRDELKRLQETELAIADDPLARDVAWRTPRRAAATPPKGRGWQGEGPRRAARFFRKPDLDEKWAPSGDHATRPARRCSAKNNSGRDDGGADRKADRQGRAAEAAGGDPAIVKRHPCGRRLPTKDPADERKKKRRPLGKTGRPGR